MAEGGSGSIRYLLSDLGGVVVRLDLARPAALMGSRCRPSWRKNPARIRRAFAEDRLLEQYERGQISRVEFLAHVRRRTGFSGTDEEFVAIWRRMFRPDDEMIRAWRQMVGRGVGLWYWSNTSEMHVPWIFDAFPEIAIHAGAVLSYQLGVTKPDLRFYRLGLEAMGAAPEQCVFVDDDLNNCIAAEACGIRSVHHVEPRRTIASVHRHFGF
ncbi:MAG: HAD family phosphatase [Kiritimatiellae bacterium]|nr:HAD family phosphatase [Kiritimatiellia bacterium]